MNYLIKRIRCGGYNSMKWLLRYFGGKMRYSQKGSWKRYTVHLVGFCDYIILARDTGVVESDSRTLGSCHIQPPCLRATRPPSSRILYVAPPRRNCLSPLLFTLYIDAPAPSLSLSPLHSRLSPPVASDASPRRPIPAHTGAHRVLAGVLPQRPFCALLQRYPWTA